MKETLLRVFEHLRWADGLALDALHSAPGHAPAVALYAHILGAESVWMGRLLGEPPTLPVWPELSLLECSEHGGRLAARYRAFVDGLGSQDLHRPVSYQTSTGTPFSTPVEDILIHVALHGSYHRGQIALLLRQAGDVPNSTDYVLFLRSADLEARDGSRGGTNP